MLAMTSPHIDLPIANAHDPPWNVPTNTFVSCAPATVGVGQYTTIIIWVDRYSPTAGGTTGQTFTFQINITQPDGSLKIIGPFHSTSALGSDYRTFVPDQVGTYKIEGSFAGATIIPSITVPTHVNIGDYFEPSTSEPAYLKPKIRLRIRPGRGGVRNTVPPSDSAAAAAPTSALRTRPNCRARPSSPRSRPHRRKAAAAALR